ncbi:hypothetical protein A2Z67_03810 [Candidatus Woesebacteria bacterium RBG_13_36_22]|uniref:Uncharacterized protein n=1 Tax=Candidatus Woesebacteria bacterium RBG_13_36_22 TaxID=1802478 RepID=A0A1F7X2H5_9BACT|nr:MAG: hypothetical protein A2Z67_03810 [Candidatus Woesebacteria bacterium RBG_13_36_22]
MSNSKIEFTRMVGSLSGDTNNHGDCFHYGSFGGCDSDCPQLRRGECDCPGENLDIIMDDEELMEVYKELLKDVEL